MKFGGTSVADAQAIGRLAAIVRRQVASQRPGEPAPVVVVSALSKVTDRLLAIAKLAEQGDADGIAVELGTLLARHLDVASAVTHGPAGESLAAALRDQFEELVGLLRALAVLREVSPRSLDTVVATGELASSRLVAAALADSGLPAAWVDARQLMVTDAEHTVAAPDMDATGQQTRAALAALTAAGQIPVVGGFIGATPAGVTTTLGRGGSDYSAAIFGAALDVDEIQIWTDVDGMLSADPRIVATPCLVPRLSFAEASELAFFGAKVLHPSTILPAVAKNIPVRILNSHRPENEGTLITAAADRRAGELAAIACKREVTVIDITSTRMLMAHGFLRRVFEVFERHKTSVDVVTTSEVSVSVTIDDTRRVGDILDELRVFAEVGVEPHMAIVSAVGENLGADSTLFARSVTALQGLPLRMVSQAASRRNVTFVLGDADVPEAMARLHRELFENSFYGGRGGRVGQIVQAAQV